MQKIKSIEKINIKGKKILIRIDVNSAVANSRPIDSLRFKEHAKTISFLIKRKAKVIILAHQGRKGGKDYLPSLKEHANILSKYINSKIKYVNDLFGKKAKEAVNSLKEGRAILLENVRNYKDELMPFSKGNRYPVFCTCFDLYVNDALSVCHRKQGSVILPPRYIKSYEGPLLKREILALQNLNLKKNAGKNIVYVFGGEKLEDYFTILNSLNSKNIKIISAGILANGILISKGINLGYENKWFKQNGYFKHIKNLNHLIEKNSDRIVLPVDFAVGNKEVRKTKRRKELEINKFPVEKKIGDIGRKTVELFKLHLQNADAVFMKGPLGFSEIPVFSYGTKEILRYLSSITKTRKVLTILCGGHLTTTIKKYRLNRAFSHISLAGGAALFYLAGKTLPGIKALEQSKSV